MDDSEHVIQELSECPAVDGATVLSILELPDSLRSTIKEMVRGRSLTIGDMCDSLDIPEETANQVIALLVEKGYVQRTSPTGDEPAFCVALAPIRGHPISDDL